MSEYEMVKRECTALTFSPNWEKKSDHVNKSLDTSHITIATQGYSDNPEEAVTAVVFDRDTYIMGSLYEANIEYNINGMTRQSACLACLELDEDGKPKRNEDGNLVTTSPAFDGLMNVKLYRNPSEELVKQLHMNLVVAQPKAWHVIRFAVNYIIGLLKPKDFQSHRTQWGVKLLLAYGIQICRAKVLEKAMDAPFTGKALESWTKLVDGGMSEHEANVQMTAESRAVGLMQVVIGLALLPSFVMDEIFRVYFFSGNDKEKNILAMPSQFMVGKEGDKKVPKTWKSLKDVLMSYGQTVLAIEEDIAIRSKDLTYRMNRHEPDERFLEVLFDKCPELEYFIDPENWVGHTIKDALEEAGKGSDNSDETGKWIPKTTKDLREQREKMQSATMQKVFELFSKEADTLDLRILDQAFQDMEKDVDESYYREMVASIVEVPEPEALETEESETEESETEATEQAS